MHQIILHVSEIVELQNIIKKDDLNYKSKCRKTCNFSKHSLSIAFLRDKHEGYLSIEGADDKQSNFANELKNFDKGANKEHEQAPEKVPKKKI